MIAARRVVRTLLLAALSLTFVHAIQAQQLRGVARDSASNLPIPGAVVTLLDTASVHGATGERRVFDGVEASPDGLVQYCQLRRGDDVVLSFRAPGMIETSRRVTLSEQVNVVTIEMKPRR
jgi:hypothetical protein